jgi:hypothetical protein
MAANLSGLASPPDAGDPRHAHIQPLLQKGRHAATAAITSAVSRGSQLRRRGTLRCVGRYCPAPCSVKRWSFGPQAISWRA